jgi:hypothetical protein
MVVSESILNFPYRNCMSAQDLPTPGDSGGVTGVADDDVFEEIGVAAHHFVLL